MSTTHPVAIIREFARRDDTSPIGTIRMTGEASLAIDGKPLPATSVEYLMNFALQSLQDSYAGAKSFDDAKAAWEGKLAKVIEGTVGARGPGSAVSDETKIGREIARDRLRAVGGAKWKAYKDADDATAKAAILDAIIERNAEAFAKLVADEITRRAKTKAKLGAMELDI